MQKKLKYSSSENSIKRCLICLKEPSDTYYFSKCSHLYCRACLTTKKNTNFQCLKGCSALIFPIDFSMPDKIIRSEYNQVVLKNQLNQGSKLKKNEANNRNYYSENQLSELAKKEEKLDPEKFGTNNDFFLQIMKIVDAFETVAKAQASTLSDLISRMNKIEEKTIQAGGLSSPGRKPSISSSANKKYYFYKNKSPCSKTESQNEFASQEIIHQLDNLAMEKAKLASLFKVGLEKVSVIDFSDSNSDNQEKRMSGHREPSIREEKSFSKQSQRIYRDKSSSSNGFKGSRPKELDIDFSQSIDINDISEHKTVITMADRQEPVTAGNSCRNKNIVAVNTNIINAYPVSDKTKFVFKEGHDAETRAERDISAKKVLKPVSSKSELSIFDRPEEKKLEKKANVVRNYNSATPKQLNSIIQGIFNNGTPDENLFHDSPAENHMLTMISLNNQVNNREKGSKSRAFKKKETLKDTSQDQNDNTESINNCLTDRFEPDIEREIIKNLMIEAYGSLNGIYHKAECGFEGEKKYIISSKWWRKWTDYVNFISTDSTNTQEIPRPGKIINTDLLNEASLNSTWELEKTLKPNLLEHYDFEVLNRNMFKFFKEWYGVDFEVIRLLKRDPLSSTKMILELYPKMKQSGSVVVGQEMNRNKKIANMLSRKMEYNKSPKDSSGISLNNYASANTEAARNTSTNASNPKLNETPDGKDPNDEF